jgi:hypothetical protein
MLEIVPDLPAGVLGFEAVGEIHSDDYRDTLLPALDAAAKDGELRLVYVLGDRFEGYSAGASWQDAKLGVEHHGTWHRAALVTDIDWVRHLTSVFGWAVPGEVKVFSLDDRDDAVAWVAAD